VFEYYHDYLEMYIANRSKSSRDDDGGGDPGALVNVRPGDTDRVTEGDTTVRSILIWVCEGTWRASVDAGLKLAPTDARITLLHVTSAAEPDAAHGAYLGLLGRGQSRRDPGVRVAELAEKAAGELLSAAASRLGRPCDTLERQGPAEREVVTAAADADLLIVARDGDQSRLGPKSLGKATRFVVDHAPCPVLLVWPRTAPGIATIPPPPDKGPPDKGPPDKGPQNKGPQDKGRPDEGKPDKGKPHSAPHFHGW
jgi:nucleotide-binding universal stress UspA family protein